MADLLCAERIVDRVAEADPVIFQDQRVMDNLLASEQQYMPKCFYFHQIQPDLKPFMRKVVTTWMMEVCEEERCEPQVFSLAVNLLDRFLCERPGVQRSQLQMVACVCLLVASKARQCHALAVSRLVYFTDYSVTAEQIRQFEVVLLGRLGWDLSSVTGFDFVDHVLERVTWSRERPLVRRHARTLVDLCYTEPGLMLKTPSLIASACLVAAARGLRVRDTLPSVCDLTRCRPDDVRHAADYVEALVKLQTQEAEGVPPRSSAPTPAAAPKQTPADAEDDRQPETPTDVQEIFF